MSESLTTTADSRQQTDKSIRVAILGNPNTGKSTIFNGLSGIKQKTGNYAGVTVEKRVGKFSVADQKFELIDLPGTYSLAPNTPDEMVSVNVLLGKSDASPDVIVCVVDASNLERNLFLVSQVLELERPTVVALNMIDVAQNSGQSIDVKQMSTILGIPVVPMQAKRGIGFDELKTEIARTADLKTTSRHDPFQDEIAERIKRLEKTCPSDCHLRRFALTRMLFDTNGFMTEQMRDQIDDQFFQALQSEQQQLKAEGLFAESESNARYAWIHKHLPQLVTASTPGRTLTDKIDRLLTHPILGLVLAAVVMVLTFQLVFWAAEPASAAIDWLTGLATMAVDQLFILMTGAADGALHSLLVNGVIAGVGGVLVFLPQIMLLFLILAILEDSGYLARLAFLTDKYLSKIGLSGVTLIPLLSSFACAIPGIMGTRVIKNERERLITILIAPLMSCSARLPVYTLMIAAFVPATTYWGFGLQGLVMFAMYLVGIVVAIAVAWILKKTMLKTGSSTFVMELPTYKIPSLKNVWHKMFQGGWAFVKDAGTIIVAATIVIWAAAYFPHRSADLPTGLLDQKQNIENQMADLDKESQEFESLNDQLGGIDNQIAYEHLQNSYLARAGRLVEPVVKPLGWDWRIGSAAIASFPAREVIVSTMGVLFGLGDEVDEESGSLKTSIKNATWDGSDRKLFTLPVALSIMIFFALCAQCSSTLAVIKRETNSWRWPIFTFVYMTVLAYIGALLVYQLTNLFWGS